MSDVFDDHTEDQGPPEDWKPSWSRWQAMRARGLELARRLKTETERGASLEQQLEEKGTEMEALRAQAETERGELQGRLEQSRIGSIDGIHEPDMDLFRAKHAKAMEELPEAKRVGLVDWMEESAKGWSEEPDTAPRWAQGFLGEPPKVAEGDTPSTPSARPPTDQTRRPTPRPSGGYTEDQINAMTPEQYKQHRESLIG
jgi:hypothetical protein